MKSILPPQIGPNREVLIRARSHAVTQVRTHGTQRLPAPTRGITAQRANGGALVTWNLPKRYDDVTGFRIYTDTEKNLSIQIKDRGTRQVFVPLTTGVTDDDAPMTNIFVSAVNGFREGPRVQIQTRALSLSGPTTVPTPPQGFLDEFSGGLDKTQSGQPSGKRVP